MAIGPVDRFREFLRRKNASLTPERESVVKAVFSETSYFDVERWIDAPAGDRASMSPSRSTVYRTLYLMQDAGLISLVTRIPDHRIFAQLIFGTDIEVE